MNNRKRWASKEEAKEFATKALQEGRTGLSFCAACDYLGWKAAEFNNDSFHDVLYADWLLSMGEEYIKEEIQNIKWEINTIYYLEGGVSRAQINELESYLQLAKEELKYLQSEEWKRR